MAGVTKGFVYNELEGEEHMSQANMAAAKKAKNDEFYTRIEDVGAELWHYRDHFRDKTVVIRKKG